MKPHWSLFPLSPLYGLATVMRNWLYDLGILNSVDVGVPVISIGNITAGGSGKTPIVMNAASIFLDAKKRVAIISRGYGRETKGTIIVSDGQNILADADSGGDEPLLIALQLKNAIVISDEDRVRGARKAIEDFGAEVIVLDDGFQHRHIKRIKDIVLIDSQQSPFETMLLPAGYRRETPGSLKRADSVIVTKVKDEDTSKMLLSSIKLDSVQHKFSSSFRPSGIKHLFGGVVQSIDMLKGHTAIAFCGIAKPESFKETLSSCGVDIREFFSFGDHHRYLQSEIEMIVRSMQSHKTDFIMTTEKDAMRLTGFEAELGQIPISALTMDVSIHPSNEWRNYLLSVLN